MPRDVDLAQVGRVQPAVDDRVGGELGVVQIPLHHRSAAHPNLAHALVVGVANLNLDALDGSTHAVAPKRLEVVDRDHRRGFAEPVADRDGNAQLVEELHQPSVDGV